MSPRDPEAPGRPRGVVLAFEWVPGLTRILGAPSRGLLVQSAQQQGKKKSQLVLISIDECVARARAQCVLSRLVSLPISSSKLLQSPFLGHPRCIGGPHALGGHMHSGGWESPTFISGRPSRPAPHAPWFNPSQTPSAGGEHIFHRLSNLVNPLLVTQLEQDLRRQDRLG